MRTALANELAPEPVSISSAALAWEGFSQGLGSPVDIRMYGVTLGRAEGRSGPIEIPQARVTLAFLPLLAGRIEPRRIELDRPIMTVRRGADGGLSLFLGARAQAAPADAGPAVAAIITELGSPRGRPDTGVPFLSELSDVLVRQAELTVVDTPSGTTWHVPDANFDLHRREQGGVEAGGDVTVSLGLEQARLSGEATIAPGAPRTDISVRLDGLRVAALGQAVPQLGVLAGIDTIVRGEGRLSVSPQLTIMGFGLNLTAGPGTVRVADGTVPIVSAAAKLEGRPDDFRFDPIRITLPASRPVVLSGSSRVRMEAGVLDADVAIGVDHVRFTDLAALWPAGLVRGGREWVLENITDGVAHDGHFSLRLSLPPQGEPRILAATGSIAGDGLTVHWLRPVPPAVAGTGVLRLLNADALEITIGSARQIPELPDQQSPLVVNAGVVRITGLEEKDQTATVSLGLGGSVATVLGLLADKRLNLLARSKVRLREPAGQLSGSVNATVPLLAALSIDQVPINARAKLMQLHLADLLAGLTLSDGVLEMLADNDGMTLNGQAMLGGIPAHITAVTDFRAGPPTQVQRRVTLIGEPRTEQLAALGLSTQGILVGILPMTATLTEQRNGAGLVTARVDLTRADLNVAPLGWRKPGGVAASAAFELVLDEDKLQRIPSIDIRGSDLLFQGHADFADGRLVSVRADRLTLGQTKAQATVQFPKPGGGFTATISGSALDLSRRFAPGNHQGFSLGQGGKESKRGPAWQADLRFDTVVLAHGQTFSTVAAHVVNDGERFRDLRLQGYSSGHQPVLAVIAPSASGRSLRVTAADAGAVLRALDIAATVEGGRLGVAGEYHDNEPGRPLAGALEMDDFRVRNAPAFGKLLQAVTLYGLFDALKGPGIGFSRLIAPFRLENGVLRFAQARAFSPSLGLTAQGSINLDTARIDLQGTVVPAYFFNSLLGRMPLIGRLFSPEEGGGLIAASYRLHGDLDDPAVSVNPLTALTPGFLRGLFAGR